MCTVYTSSHFSCSQGFLVGALATIYVTKRFGFGKIIVFGALCQIVGYIIQVFAPPFPAFLISFAITGVGIQLQVRHTLHIL